MPMLPSPICPLAGQSIFGQNVVCGSMTHLPSALSTEECHLIRSVFQVLRLDHRLAYTYPAYSPERKEQILRAYQERSSLRGLERTFGVARSTVISWLKKKPSSSRRSEQP